MPSVHVDKVGEMAIIECAGRFVRTETALKLQDAVTSQTDAHVVVLDLTEMHAIGGGGLGVLVLLQGWAQDHGIRFKLFNPWLVIALYSPDKVAETGLHICPPEKCR